MNLPGGLLAVSVLWTVFANAAGQQQIYRVAIDREYAPFEFVDIHGEAQGYTPALLRAIGADAGVQFEFIPMNWPDAVASLKAGKVDIINMIVTPDRTDQFLFSAPHSRVSQALFRHKNKKNIVNPASLAGHKVGFQKNDISLDKLADRTDFTRHIVESKAEGLLHLNLGSTDAFLCAQQACIRTISEYGFLNIELAAGDLFSQDYAFATRQGNQPLIELLNQHVTRIKASGKLQLLDAQWLHGQVVQPNWLYQNKVALSLLACVLLAAIILLWNISLRKLVNSRTNSLVESEFLWKFAIEGSCEGVWDWNIPTDEVKYSRRWKEMLAYPEYDIRPTRDELVKRIHPDDRSAIAEIMQSYLEGRIQTYIVEFRLRCKDGSYKWILERGMVVSRSKNGKPLRMIGTHADMTERKNVEKKLSDSMRLLENKELAKTRFLAAAGHDLRQPLAAVNMFMFALQSTASTPKQTELIQRINHAMKTFKELLDALLNVSKLDSNMITPKFTAINVAELLIWLEQHFVPIAGEKQISFKLYFPISKPLVVRSDIGLLKSVLMNLVANAIKFTAKGSVLVSVRQRGRDALFQVWDTGMGIPTENIEYVFDEFYQIDNPQRDRTSGLGLGLAIVKRTLALFESEITCRSQRGRGTVFEFRLPLADSSSTVQRPFATTDLPEKATDCSFAKGKQFVLVEDDMLVAQATTTMIEGMGGEVKCFHRAEDALLNSDIEQTDYYIVDYMLGGTLNGIQFLNTLRQKSGKPIHAVLVTGDTSSNFIRDAANIDWPVEYKPVNVSVLLASLHAQGKILLS